MKYLTGLDVSISQIGIIWHSMDLKLGTTWLNRPIAPEAPQEELSEISVILLSKLILSTTLPVPGGA